MSGMKEAINRITEQDLKAFENNPNPDMYQKIAIQSAIYPGRKTIFGLAYCTLKLNGEAGELAEHVGKSWRDDGAIEITDGIFTPQISLVVGIRPLTDVRREYLLKELGDCLWYIAAICTELGVSLRSVMALNLFKLHKRSTSGNLQGSGDDR
jgi:NTP pyrophosphatase (non-canonical NTP hydrolase)